VPPCHSEGVLTTMSTKNQSLLKVLSGGLYITQNTYFIIRVTYKNTRYYFWRLRETGSLGDE